MKSIFLTRGQLQWIMHKNINVGEFYSFPSYGFTVYAKPNFSCGEWTDTNSFTKGLAGEAFLVKDKVDGFCKGDLLNNPRGSDMYIREYELMKRDIVERLFLLIIAFIPLVMYNSFKHIFTGK